VPGHERHTAVARPASVAAMIMAMCCGSRAGSSRKKIAASWRSRPAGIVRCKDTPSAVSNLHSEVGMANQERRTCRGRSKPRDKACVVACVPVFTFYHVSPPGGYLVISLRHSPSAPFDRLFPGQRYSRCGSALLACRLSQQCSLLLFGTQGRVRGCFDGRSARRNRRYCFRRSRKQWFLTPTAVVFTRPYMVFTVLTQRGAEGWADVSMGWETWHEGGPCSALV